MAVELRAVRFPVEPAVSLDAIEPAALDRAAGTAFELVSFPSLELPIELVGGDRLTVAEVARLFGAEPTTRRRQSRDQSRTASPVATARRTSPPSTASDGLAYAVVSKLTTLLLVASLLAGWAILGLTVAQKVGGYEAYTVLSGSMRPGIQVGALILEHKVPATAIRKGDIVSFHPPGRNDAMITHRVVQLVTDPPGTAPGKYFATQGDANSARDGGYLPVRGEYGRVTGWLNGVGYAAAFLQQLPVKIALLVIPLLLAASLVIMNIWRPARET